MDDPLLSSLCSICHISTPKYTCPRCSIQTCSLSCSRRHKLWAACSGVRDPTVFKPISQLATPSGVDHDYNFLHSIEHQIERSEKRIVEDRGLVNQDELAAARKDELNGWHVKMRKRKRLHPGQEQIERTLKRLHTTVELAPKGMKRSVENATTWSKGNKTIHWQVEWIREGHAGRSLSRVLGYKPIGEAYGEFLTEERKRLMTDEEKRLEKSEEKKERKRLAQAAAKPNGAFNLFASTVLQDPNTEAWCSAPAQTVQALGSIHKRPNPSILGCHFYLHRPKTESNFPKILIPLDPAKSLDHILQRRLILEFPTLYVLKTGPDDLESEYMSERDYLAATRRPPLQDSDTEMRDESESQGTESSEKDTGSEKSDSCSDDNKEEGEISEEE